MDHSESHSQLLVHNVSHADLCLTLQPASVIGIQRDRELMAKPRSSRYKHVCNEIMQAIQGKSEYKAVSYKDQANHLRCVGFEFHPPCQICSWSDFILRNPNADTTRSSLSCCVARVFFPLVSVILPKWISLSQPQSNLEYQSHISSPVFMPRINLAASLHPIPPEDSPDLCMGEDSHTANSNRASPDIEYLSSEEHDNTHENPDETHDDAKDMLEKPSTMHTLEHKYSDTNEEHETKSQLSHHFPAPVFKLFIVSGAGKQSDKQIYEQQDSTRQLADLLSVFIHGSYPEISTQVLYSDDIFRYNDNINFVHSQLRPAIDEERLRLSKIHGKRWDRYFSLCITLCEGTPARLISIVQGLRSFRPDMLHMFRCKTLWLEYPKLDKLWDEDFEYLRFNQLETYPEIPLSNITDESVRRMVEEMRRWQADFVRAAVTNQDSEMTEFWIRKTHQPVLAVLCVDKMEGEGAKYYRGVNVEVSMPTGSLCAERNAIGTALAEDPAIKRAHFRMIAVLFMGELCEERAERAESVDSKMTPLMSGRSGGTYGSPRYRSGSVIGGMDDPDDVNPRGPCGPCMEWLGKIAECNPSFKVVTFANRSLQEVIVRNLK